MTSGPDPGEFPGFWGSIVFRHQPIPRKGSGNQQQQQFKNNTLVIFQRLVNDHHKKCSLDGIARFLRNKSLQYKIFLVI